MSSRRQPPAGMSPPVGMPDGLARTQLAGFALLPLRAFLGFTFSFAGLQKLANPGFFHASNPASMQAQLAAAARLSPIHALLGPLSHHAVAVGVLIALGELAVGVGTLAGLLTRVAALGGLLISFGLFLSVSFHTSPYYTGSDIVFVFAWAPLLIAGGGPLSLDAWAVATVAKRRRAGSWRSSGQPADVQRRQLVGGLAAALGAVALFGAGAAAGLGRLFHGGSAKPLEAASLGGGSASPSAPAAPATAAAPTTAVPTAAAPTTGAAKTTAPSHAATHPAGVKLGPASAVPVKGAASFTDPASGEPALIIQPSPGKFLAFNAVCPHAGCIVEYDASNTTFICPCHGSRFNATTGAVEAGPASQGLGEIPIAEAGDGQLYAK